MIGAIFIFTGALWRRWLGGFPQEPDRIIKVFFGFMLATTAVALAGAGMWQSLLAGILIVSSFLPGHGSYMNPYATDTDNEFLRLVLRAILPIRMWDGPDYRLIGMVLRYSIFTVPIGFVLGSVVYMMLGLWIALIYHGLARIDDKLPRTGRLLDGFTSYSELVAGALLIGGGYLLRDKLFFGWLDSIIRLSQSAIW